MERSPGIVRLFRTAQKLARELGVELEESLTGGGSDGNFTAALGVPDAGRSGRRGRRRARGERKHPGGPDRGPHGADRQAAGGISENSRQREVGLRGDVERREFAAAPAWERRRRRSWRRCRWRGPARESRPDTAGRRPAPPRAGPSCRPRRRRRSARAPSMLSAEAAARVSNSSITARWNEASRSSVRCGVTASHCSDRWARVLAQQRAARGDFRLPCRALPPSAARRSSGR